MEYKITVSDDDIEIVNPDNSEVLSNRIKWLMQHLNRRYPQMSYVYIAEHKRKKNLYKIGVSDRPQRRETQIPGLMVKQYPCERELAFEIEADLHNDFYEIGVHHEGEWFWLKGDGYDFIASLPDEDITPHALPIWSFGCGLNLAANAICSSNEYTADEKRAFFDRTAASLRELAAAISGVEYEG